MKIHKIKKITDHDYVNLFAAQYEDRAGQDKKWIFASRSDETELLEKQKTTMPDAVVVVPFHTQEKKLVLIKEFRVALGGYQYGFPAGLLDPGESVEQAGTRELFEETGLNITKVLKISPGVFSSSGLTDESVAMFFADCDGAPTNEYNEASEDIEVLMLSRQDASGILYDPELKFDVKTWIVLKSFADHGII